MSKEKGLKNILSDTNGNPITFYHGTSRNNAKSIKENGFDITKGNHGLTTISLTSSLKQASNYGDEIVEAFVSMDNPMDLETNFKIREEVNKEVTGKSMSEMTTNDWVVYTPEINKRFLKKAIELGYDGVYEPSNSEITVFNPNDIKLKNVSKEKEFKKILESIPESELNALTDAFKEAFNKFVKIYKDKLTNIQDEIKSKKDKIEELRIKEKQAVYPESSKLFQERMDLGSELILLEKRMTSINNCLLAIENWGEVVSIEDKKGLVNDDISDLRRVDTNQFIFDEKTILTDKKPPYIPEIDEDVFRRKGYIFDAIRYTNDSYLLAINGFDDKDPLNTYYSLLTLDQLVLTQDYYYTKAKALNIKEAERKNKSNEENWDGMTDERKERFLMQRGIYHSLPASIKKKINQQDYESLGWQEREKIYKFFKRYKAKRLKSQLGSTYMWTSYHEMYERFINPNATMPKPRTANSEVWAYWVWFRDMMEYKSKDIKFQREDYSESYKAAMETSFGESNTDTSLKKDFGVLVKRQNGDKINPIEIGQIKDSIESVQAVFGNLKPNFEKYNIKISHSGKRLIFAMKAVGVFIPSFGTIGISDKYGDTQFRMTTAHEFAHFIDYFVGETNKKRWATDDYESIAGKIAFTFRDNMNKPKNQQSDYINATKECFARALQQFYGIEQYGEDAGIVFVDGKGGLGDVKPYFTYDSFVGREAYYKEVRPLIVQFFEENKDILQYTYDIDESNEPLPVGDEVSEYDKAIKDLEERKNRTVFLPYIRQYDEAISVINLLKDLES